MGVHSGLKPVGVGGSGSRMPGGGLTPGDHCSPAPQEQKNEEKRPEDEEHQSAPEVQRLLPV